MSANTIPSLAAMHIQQKQPVKAGAAADPEAVSKTAKEFEAMFLGQMMQQMFAQVKTDGLFGGGHGEEMFRSLLVDQYAKEIAAGPGLGMSQAVERQLLKLQEVG
jgi:flagellar protein FlgJ